MVLWEIEDKAIGIRTGLNQCNFDDAVQSSQATPTRGGGGGLRWLFKSLYWTAPSLPFAQYHQFRLQRLQELEARRGRHPAPPFLPRSLALTLTQTTSL